MDRMPVYARTATREARWWGRLCYPLGVGVAVTTAYLVWFLLLALAFMLVVGSLLLSCVVSAIWLFAALTTRGIGVRERLTCTFLSLLLAYGGFIGAFYGRLVFLGFLPNWGLFPAAVLIAVLIGWLPFFLINRVVR